jgi:hypothetical protein
MLQFKPRFGFIEGSKGLTSQDNLSVCLVEEMDTGIVVTPQENDRFLNEVKRKIDWRWRVASHIRQRCPEIRRQHF